MPERNIIFQLSRSETSTEILPLYRFENGGKILSLKVELYLPSYPLAPWPELSSENTEELNDAIIAKNEFDNAQINLHFFIRDDLGSWVFLRTCPLINRGVPLSIDVLKPYRSIFGYLPVQKGYGLGIFWQFLEGRPQEIDSVIIIGDVEENILLEGGTVDDTPFEGVRMLPEETT